MENAYRPSAGTVRNEYFPDDTNEQYYKLGAWYEFAALNFGSFYNESWCKIEKYTATGGAWKGRLQHRCPFAMPRRIC